MNKRSKSKNYVIDFLILTIFVLALIIILNSRTVLGNLVSSTATPSLSTLQLSPIVPTGTETGLPNTVFPPKPTPIIEGTPQPTPITIDLAPDIPFNEKQQIGVEHSNGVYNIYLIKPGSATSLDELKKIIPFGPGDRLVYWGQPAFTYRTVPPPQIPTLTPIPLTPTTPTAALPTDMPTPFYTPTPISYPNP